tara:strand:+ start:170 stop:1102 length:933 start_codon:yes stop_codon:yes gene_type:complete
MGWEGPYYFLECGNRDARVSLPKIKKFSNRREKKLNAAEYWSKRLGLDLNMPDDTNDYSNPPHFQHTNYADPEVIHNKIVNGENEITQSVDVACPHCDEHLSIEVPFEDEYVCPNCDGDFAFDSNQSPKSSGNVDWYSSHRETLLEAIINHTLSKNYEVLEEQKRSRGISAIDNTIVTFFGLILSLVLTLFSGAFLLMFPLSLSLDSEIPIIMALIMSIIGILTIIPCLKFVRQIISDFFKPETHEKYTLTQYFDPVRKYIAWVEVINSSTEGRSGSLFVISEAVLRDSHVLKSYYVYFSHDTGGGGGGG